VPDDLGLQFRAALRAVQAAIEATPAEHKQVLNMARAAQAALSLAIEYLDGGGEVDTPSLQEWQRLYGWSDRFTQTVANDCFRRFGVRIAPNLVLVGPGSEFHLGDIAVLVRAAFPGSPGSHPPRPMTPAELWAHRYVIEAVLYPAGLWTDEDDLPDLPP
jgi:hypothetical protein